MRILSVVLLVCATFGSAYGQDKKPAASTTAEQIRQLERDWADAMKAADTDKLSALLADDWTSLGYDGKKVTKAQYLAGFKSGDSKVESFEIGPMDVKFVAGVAVVQGSDTEKSSTKGKDTGGKWVWMDVFAKRDGKWQAVRSQAAMVK